MQPPNGSIAYGPLADWIGFQLRMAQAASFQAFARAAKGIDLRPGRFALLTLVGANPGIGQTALSRANGRDKSTLTPMIDDLVRGDLLRRERADEDRRAYRLFLTKSGEKELAALTACAKQHEARLDEIIGTRNRAAFSRVLRRIAVEL